MVKRGDVDLITSFGKTPQRSEYVHYLGPPYDTEHLVFYVRKDNNISIQKYTDLYKFRLGTTKGSVYFSQFDNDVKLDKISLNNEFQLFKMLDSDRIDAFIGYETVIDYQIVIHGFKGKSKKMSYRVPGLGSYMAMSKRSRASRWHSAKTKQIQVMIEQGEIEKIINTFLSNTTHQAMDRQVYQTSGKQ